MGRRCDAAAACGGNTLRKGSIPRAKEEAVVEVVGSLEGYSVSPSSTAGGQ